MKIGIFLNMGKEALYTFWGKLISILQAKHIEYYVAEYARGGFESRDIAIDKDRYKSTNWMGKNLKYILSLCTSAKTSYNALFVVSRIIRYAFSIDINFSLFNTDIFI